jgi:hypothetical protein
MSTRKERIEREIDELAAMYPNGDPRAEPTWFNQKWHARQLLKEKGYAEVLRHARVSIDNRCSCDCFCCACRHVLKEERK